jgi:hypothetical protein
MSLLTLSLPKQSAAFFQLVVMKYEAPASIAVATINESTNSFGNGTAGDGSARTRRLLKD